MVAESTGHAVLLRRAALPVIARIERDRARVAHPKLKIVMTILASSLFDRKTNVNSLKMRSHFRTNNISAMLRERLGLGLRAYIEARRLETAETLLAETKLPIQTLATLIGYASVQAFSGAFHRTHGERPQAYRLRAHQRQAERPRALWPDGQAADEQRDTPAMPALYTLAPLSVSTHGAVCTDCQCSLPVDATMHMWRGLEPLCALCARDDPHAPRLLIAALASTPGAIVRDRLTLPLRSALSRPDLQLAQLSETECARLIERLIGCIDAVNGLSIAAWRQGGPVQPTRHSDRCETIRTASVSLAETAAAHRAAERGAMLDAFEALDGLADAQPGEAMAAHRAAVRAQCAEYCLGLGNAVRAEALLEEALDEPVVWSGLPALYEAIAHNRAVAAYARRRDDQAKARLNALPACARAHVAALRLRGLLCLRMGRVDAAVRVLCAVRLQLANDARPLEMAQVLADLGQVYIRFGRPRDFAEHVGCVLEQPVVRRLLLADLEPRRARIGETWATRQLDALIAALRDGV
ncbi:MAG: helix-turn-helix domain-containing protein [Acidobacteriota bacterium]